VHALSTAKYGCHIGLFFVGALDYADDLVLLASSANATRKCYKFVITLVNVSLLYLMPVNPIKCMFFSSHNKSHHLYATNRVNSVLHVGLVLSAK